MGFRHVGFRVKDLDESVKFYRKLGYDIFYNKTEDWTGTFGIQKIIKMKYVGNSCCDEVIELIEDKNVENSYFKSAHVAINVYGEGQLDKLEFDWFIAPRKSPDGSVRLAFLKDPDGYLIELVENPRE
jgi:catechol 2,3-dioxygenase-like lactoylglutathione lyase family enzyme